MREVIFIIAIVFFFSVYSGGLKDRFTKTIRKPNEAINTRGKWKKEKKPNRKIVQIAYFSICIANSEDLLCFHWNASVYISISVANCFECISPVVVSNYELCLGTLFFLFISPIHFRTLKLHYTHNTHWHWNATKCAHSNCLNFEWVEMP